MQIIFKIDMYRTMIKLFKNLKKLKLADSTVMPNQSNSPQTTEPTEPIQDIDNSNSPSEEIIEVSLRQDYVLPKGGIKGCYKVIKV